MYQGMLAIMTHFLTHIYSMTHIKAAVKPLVAVKGYLNECGTDDSQLNYKPKTIKTKNKINFKLKEFDTQVRLFISI